MVAAEAAAGTHWCKIERFVSICHLAWCWQDAPAHTWNTQNKRLIGKTPVLTSLSWDVTVVMVQSLPGAVRTRLILSENPLLAHKWVT